jgi:hypothetical protein
MIANEAARQAVIEVLLRHLPRLAIICLAVVLVVVPRRWWGRATWIRWALSSALCTSLLLADVLSVVFAAFRARAPVLQGRIVMLALLCTVSAIVTVATSGLAIREWKARND